MTVWGSCGYTHRIFCGYGDRNNLREGKLGRCPGPPQLGGLQKTVKNYYLRKHKILFETDILE